MIEDFLRSQDGNKANDANQKRSIERDKAWQLNGSSIMIQPRHGWLIMHLSENSCLDNIGGGLIVDGHWQAEKTMAIHYASC